MMPRKTDETYLWDMRETAIEAVRVLKGIDREGFLGDSIRTRAIERLIEILGEAAFRVSREKRTETPQIPWDKIIGQRHVLAHEYGEIDCGRLFDVVAVHLPALIVERDHLGLESSVLRPDPDRRLGT